MVLPRLLLIDDDEVRTQQFESVLSFMDYHVLTTKSESFSSMMESVEGINTIFIGNGCEKQASLISTVLGSSYGVPIVLLMDKGAIAQTSSAILKMVTQPFEWPTRYSILNDVLKKLSSVKNETVKPKKNVANKGLAGSSLLINQVRELIDQVASCDATVLVLGESGTGKEVVAQALHRASDRKNKPFVPINCGAIPGELLESELFGHEKGAFTGALSSRQGRFEMAEGGTLFLDEIGDMPMPMQVKLLRVLQERKFERIGSNKTIECNVRIVAATHRNLENEIIEKRFREDLFYRLNVFPIELPSLQDRTEDIPLLVRDLTARMSVEKRGNVEFTINAMALMMQHPWPGNVRELSNFIERVAITHPNAIVDSTGLPSKFQEYQIPDGFVVESIEQHNIEEQEVDEESSHQAMEQTEISEGEVSVISQLPEQGMDLKEYLNDMEVNLIQQALSECNGVVAHAAKLLNMRRTTLVEKLRKYEMS